MCNYCPDYDDYEPEYTRADAEYDAYMEELWEEEQIRLEDQERELLPEDYDESTLTDEQWDALDAKMRADEVNPPQPPAWMQEAWDYADI